MRKIFRKNQIIITALALMIAVAGYISYTQTADEDTVETAAEETADTYEISDEDTVTEIFTDTEDDTEIASGEAGDDGGDSDNDSDDSSGTGTDGSDSAETEDTDSTEAGETVLTSSAGTVDYASEVKLNREQVRSKNKETLQEIIDSTSLTDAQKQEAVDALVKITDLAERENAAEVLLAAKGFTDVVVSITDDTADVVLNMGDVTDAKRAQVEDIVKRKTGISAENIIITPITE